MPGLGVCEVKDCRLCPVLAPQLRVVVPDGLLGVEGVWQRPPGALQQVQQVQPVRGMPDRARSPLEPAAGGCQGAARGCTWQMQALVCGASLEVAIQEILLRIAPNGHRARRQQAVEPRQLSARGRHQKEACRAVGETGQQCGLSLACGAKRVQLSGAATASNLWFPTRLQPSLSATPPACPPTHTSTHPTRHSPALK